MPIFSHSHLLTSTSGNAFSPIGMTVSDHVTVFNYAVIFKFSHFGNFCKILNNNFLPEFQGKLKEEIFDSHVQVRRYLICLSLND